MISEVESFEDLEVWPLLHQLHSPVVQWLEEWCEFGETYAH